MFNTGLKLLIIFSMGVLVTIPFFTKAMNKEEFANLPDARKWTLFQQCIQTIDRANDRNLELCGQINTLKLSSESKIKQLEKQNSEFSYKSLGIKVGICVISYWLGQWQNTRRMNNKMTGAYAKSN